MRETKTLADALAASEGRLRKILYVIHSEAAQGFLPIKENIEAHLRYLSELESNGKLLMAGPLLNLEPDAWSGDGMLIYQVDSFEEAKQIAENDPLHLSGARNFSIRQWILNDGCLNLQVRLSNQTIDLK